MRLVLPVALGFVFVIAVGCDQLNKPMPVPTTGTSSSASGAPAPSVSVLVIEGGAPPADEGPVHAQPGDVQL